MAANCALPSADLAMLKHLCNALLWLVWQGRHWRGDAANYKLLNITKIAPDNVRIKF